MLGMLVGGALSAMGGIFGGMAKNDAIERQQKDINQRKQENQNWYDRRYNEDATQRADAQRILSLTEDAIKRRNRAAEGRAAVMGGTEESVAATKEANAKAQADAAAQIAAAGEARKDRIEQQYLGRKNELNDKLDGLEGQKSSGYDMLGSAIGGLSSSLGSFSSLSGLFGKKKDAGKEE